MDGKTKKVLIWITVAVAGLIAVLIYFGLGERPATYPDAAEVGESVTVGAIKWTVTDAERQSEIQLDDGRSKAVKAEGVFVVVELMAQLTGAESEIVDSRQFTIIDSQKRVFKSTDKFAVYGDFGSIYLKQVAPNAPVTGKAIFDIPDDASGLTLEIKDLRRGSNQKGYFNLGF